jgi:hypothetical protein
MADLSKYEAFPIQTQSISNQSLIAIVNAKTI